MSNPRVDKKKDVLLESTIWFTISIQVRSWHEETLLLIIQQIHFTISNPKKRPCPLAATLGVDCWRPEWMFPYDVDTTITLATDHLSTDETEGGRTTAVTHCWAPGKLLWKNETKIFILVHIYKKKPKNKQTSKPFSLVFP